MLKKDRWNDTLPLFLYSSSSQKSHTVLLQKYLLSLLLHILNNIVHWGRNFMVLLKKTEKSIRIENLIMKVSPQDVQKSQFFHETLDRIFKLL